MFQAKEHIGDFFHSGKIFLLVKMTVYRGLAKMKIIISYTFCKKHLTNYNQCGKMIMLLKRTTEHIIQQENMIDIKSRKRIPQYGSALFCCLASYLNK
jgi:hypothetical protein